MELVAARCGLDAAWDEAELVKGEVTRAVVGGDAAAEHAGDDAAEDGIAAQRAGGGGLGGTGGELLSLFIGLDLAVE